VTGLVPQSNHRVRRVVLVAERAQARGAQHEESAVNARLDAEPPGRQYADEMTAREQQHVSPNGAYALHHPVRPRADLPGRLASAAAAAEDLPAPTLRKNFGGATALVFAVVPLHEIGIDLGHRGEAGELARPESTPQGTREHLRERQPPQPLPEPARIALA